MRNRNSNNNARLELSNLIVSAATERLTTELTIVDIMNAQDIHTLDLSFNYGCEPKNFRRIIDVLPKNLRSLNLTKCSLQFFKNLATDFRKLPSKLQYIDLCQNFEERNSDLFISAVKNLPKSLKILRCGYNEIAKYEANKLDKLCKTIVSSNLTTLNLKGEKFTQNQLDIISHAFKKSYTLTTILFDKNSAFNYSNFDTITKRNLNYIPVLIGAALAAKQDLASCHIKRLPAELLEKICKFTINHDIPASGAYKMLSIISKSEYTFTKIMELNAARPKLLQKKQTKEQVSAQAELSKNKGTKRKISAGLFSPINRRNNEDDKKPKNNKKSLF